MRPSKTKLRRLEYDVALSFAEEDRTFVHAVANHLKAKNVRIFYDKDEMIYSWGRDLDGPVLDDPYRRNAKFCVMFISKHYKEKRWTKRERILAQARSFEEHKDYILPFRFDDTEIEEVKGSIVYLSAQEYNEERLANAIIDKIENSKSRFTFFIQRLERFFSSRTGILSLFFLILCSILFTFSDKVTPVSILTRMIYERNKDTYHAVCRDGTLSHAHGRGTCSGHDGVDYYKDSTVHKKSIEQCQKEAETISWLPR